MFPLGEFTKEQTREMARRYGLRIAEKIESQDLCFVPDGEYRNFLRRHIPHALRSGPIVDRAGHELARHEGLALYTIGQRKGLNVAVGEPLYVLELDAERNAVVVGKKSELGSRELVAREVNFISGRAPEGEIRVMAKIRYRATEVEATLTPSPSPGEGEGRTVRVVFDVPLRDITPGQSVVFYDGEVCLGGGIIERVTSDVGRVT
jgi:tRNA-specific 2-thiouridylase